MFEMSSDKYSKAICSPDKYSKATSTLPPDFVNHLRHVFDKLDKQNNGYIKIADLEDYWKHHYRLDMSVSNSPIIKRLNEIAPCNMGLVSFPRLCTGVKEALMQAKKTHKNRKVSFLNALSINEDVENNKKLQTTEEEGGSTVVDENNNVNVIDENNNVDVVCYSPPTCRKSLQQHAEEEEEEGEVECYINKHTQNKDVHKLLNIGLQVIAQIKSWYSRKNSQFYNCEISELSREEVEKIDQLNHSLQKILIQQQQKNVSGDKEELEDRVEETKGLKDRISKLEGEKSLLIRELFQLKSQLKSPTSKPYMVDV